MADSTDARGALESLFAGIKSTFSRYDRPARKRAWESITHGKGREQVEKLLNNPSYKVVGIPGLLKFKEWFLQNDT
jgi:hypothetical protein